MIEKSWSACSRAGRWGVLNRTCVYYMRGDDLICDGVSGAVHSRLFIESAPCERPEHPNPHTAGTHAWAREELRRGHAVSRSNMQYRRTATPDWKNPSWSNEDLDATDWERA